MLAGLNLSEIGLAEQVENPCVGGSIPPRATKNCPLKGRVNYSSLCQSMPFKKRQRR